MRPLHRKTIVVLLLALIAAIAAWKWRASDPQALREIREIAFDTYQQLKPRKSLGQPIRIIDIDEESIEAFGQWPWPRSRIAALLDRLRDLGALTVGFDIVFSEPDRTGPEAFRRHLDENGVALSPDLKSLVSRIPDNDRRLADAIGSLPTVLGFFNESTSRQGLPPVKAGIAILGDDPQPLLHHIESAVVSLPGFSKAAAGSGSISLSKQADDVVRRVPMFSTDGENIYPAMAIELLRVAQGARSYTIKTTTASGERSGGRLAVTEFRVGQFVVPVDETGNMLVYYSRSDPDIYVSAADLLRKDASELRPLIEGHIVLIGSAAAGLRDIRVSTLGENVPGVYIHAQIADQILSGEFLNRPDWAGGAEIAAMLVITGLIVIILPIAGAVISALFGLAMSVAVIAISWWSFTRHGLLFDPIFPMATGGAIFVMTTILLFAFAEREKRFIRGAFQRYLARDLLVKLENNPDSLKLGGEIREMTLMFMDVRGFTPISESLTPEQVVAFLNTLLSPLSKIIQIREGAIDKYIGDSIMAFWNAPLEVEDHPRKAARAALEMIDCVAALNARDAFGFHHPGIALGDVQIGIGINTGEGCVGNMGSDDRFDYSVIGDAVNIAARIESSCKAVGWPLLLSGTTAAACSDFAIVEAGSVALKGKSGEAVLYALVGDETMARTPQWHEYAKCHGRYRDCLEAGDVDAAAMARRECLTRAPVDVTSLYDSEADSALIARLRRPGAPSSVGSIV